MKYRNLRSMLIDGASRLVLSVDDGAEDGGAGGGGAAPEAAPAEPVPAEPAAGGDDPPAAAAQPAGDDEPAPRSRTPWQVKRIDALTAEKRAAEEARVEAEKRAADAEARASAYEALYGRQDGAPPPPAAAPAGGEPATKVYTQADVQAEAQRIASLQTLNDKCENLFAEGAEKHGDDWKARVEQVGKAFGPELSNRVDLFQALTKIPNAADVYHALAGDLDHFGEVLAMSPLDLGMELATLSTKVAQKPKAPAVSRVPAPIDPVGQNGGGSDVKPENMTMSDYAKGWKSPAERRADREREMRG